MKRLFLLTFLSLSVGHAQTGRDVFLASLDKLARSNDQI